MSLAKEKPQHPGNIHWLNEININETWEYINTGWLIIKQLNIWHHNYKESYTRPTLLAISHMFANPDEAYLFLCSTGASECVLAASVSLKDLSYFYSLLNFYLSSESRVNFPAKRHLIWFLWKRHRTLFIGVLKSEWNLIWKKCNSSRLLGLHFRNFSALCWRNKKEAENEMQARNAGESGCFFDKWRFS